MDDRLKILIAEDEITSSILLRAMLSPFGDSQVAADGRAALALFAAALGEGVRPFDLVCLDLVMPGLDGQRVLREIRRLEGEQGRARAMLTPVFVITSLGDSENITEAIAVGRCQDYLLKPVQPKRLEELLRRHRLLT